VAAFPGNWYQEMTGHTNSTIPFSAPDQSSAFAADQCVRVFFIYLQTFHIPLNYFILCSLCSAFGPGSFNHKIYKICTYVALKYSFSMCRLVSKWFV